MLISHQVDQREYPDPDDVQRVPEQAPAQQAPQNGGWQALRDHLRYQIDERDQAAGNVNAVCADQSEEGGQKAAARGSAATKFPKRRCRFACASGGRQERERSERPSLLQNVLATAQGGDRPGSDTVLFGFVLPKTWKLIVQIS